MAANIPSVLVAVSLAPLVTWTKVEFACTLLAALDLLTLTVGRRRDPGNRRLTKASASARKLLVYVGPLSLVTFATFFQFSQSSDAVRYPDAVAFFVALLTVAGWATLVGTVVTLIGGVYALVAPGSVAMGTHDDERAPQPEAPLTAVPAPPEAQQEAAQPAHEEQAAGPRLSPWIELFVLLNIGELAVRAATLFVRGPQALLGAVTGNAQLSVLISLGGGVLYTAFVAGLSWLQYSDSPRLTRALLAVLTVLTGLATLYEAVRLVARK